MVGGAEGVGDAFHRLAYHSEIAGICFNLGKRLYDSDLALASTATVLTLCSFLMATNTGELFLTFTISICTTADFKRWKSRNEDGWLIKSHYILTWLMRECYIFDVCTCVRAHMPLGKGALHVLLC
jgi:hypothetical protein